MTNMYKNYDKNFQICAICMTAGIKVDVCKNTNVQHECNMRIMHNNTNVYVIIIGNEEWRKQSSVNLPVMRVVELSQPCDDLSS